MSTSTAKRPGALVVAMLAGTLVAAVLALLTFGVQATMRPEGVPVAVAVPDGGPAAAQLTAAAQRVSGQGGGQLDWRVTTPEQARELLEDKEIYGILELTAVQGGPRANVVVSGAVNPAGTQVAQQALTGAGQALTAAIAQANPALKVAPVSVEQVHPAGAAGRAAPLAISALAWIGCLVAGIALTVLAERRGSNVGAGTRLLAGGSVSVLVTGVLAGYLLLWDSSLPLNWEVLGVILLTASAYAALQGGLLHWMGLKAIAILAPLYLVAPAVAGQVPELLHPGYRAGLWSWTPFRFPAEALRSLLNGTPAAPDVGLAVWVLGGMLVVGLVLLLVPKRSAGEEAEAHSPDGVVDVGVDKADRLPSTQH